ncbi:LON peptidase substrate-binding domain-containing protein [Limnohabitans sp. Rim47]|uniref:LON peptidase substrate-binding domain-containing protein n=1 Tax=Limnohabitans sp. Rim47 TaxID=1100721 RepID=UPI0002D4E359|nr:LON peptidase substrate-binding domain-containing protein [Limnohabitans sp. Rim47]
MPDNDAPSPATLTELPLFPLGTVLFPGALLPLQLFELRYLQMIGECERLGTGFGVVTLTQGREVHRPGAAADQFEPIGTRVQIERIERPQAGVVLVWCRGLERLEIHSTQQRSDGLWRGQVQDWPTEPPMPVPDHLQYLIPQIQAALATLSAQDSVRPHWPQPWALDDCAWLSHRWCELLPLPLAMKYRLFTLREPLMRLELVGDMVESTPSGGNADQKPPANS